MLYHRVSSLATVYASYVFSSLCSYRVIFRRCFFDLGKLIDVLYLLCALLSTLSGTVSVLFDPRSRAGVKHC